MRRQLRTARPRLRLLFLLLCGVCCDRAPKQEASKAHEDNKQDAKAQADHAAAKAARPLDQTILVERRGTPFVPADLQVFKDYGVGPTVDTAEQPNSTVSLDLDTASFYLSHTMILAGHLPPAGAIRVEEFVHAVTATVTQHDERQVWLTASITGSATRPGYELMHLRVLASPRPRSPVDVVIAVDQSVSMGPQQRRTANAFIAATRSALVNLEPKDTLAVVGIGPTGAVLAQRNAVGQPAGEQPATGVAPLTASAAATPDNYNLGVLNQLAPATNTAHLVVLSTGQLGPALRGDSATNLARTLRTYADAGPITVLGLGLGLGLGEAPSPFDGQTLERLAQAGRARYDYADAAPSIATRLAAHMHRPVVALDGRLSVRFDAKRVARYRLVGYESHSAPRPGGAVAMLRSALHAGESVSVVYEVKLQGSAQGPWGQVELSYQEPPSQGRDGASRSIEFSLRNMQRTRRPSVVALSAAVAEKLRQSYLSRGVEWKELARRFEALPADERSRQPVRRLGEIIEHSAQLDHPPNRPDRFERSGSTVNFEHVSVLQ